MEFACSLALALGGKIQVLFVQDEGADEAARGLPQARRELERFVATVPDAQRVAASERIEVGDARERIVAVANAGGFDAIVLGTHGRTGRARSLAGSVAESVVRTASCPVMTVRERE